MLPGLYNIHPHKTTTTKKPHISETLHIMSCVLLVVTHFVEFFVKKGARQERKREGERGGGEREHKKEKRKRERELDLVS